MTETIELNREELEMLRALAESQGVTLEEAAKIALENGVDEVLTDICPSSMAIKHILRPSKSPNK